VSVNRGVGVTRRPRATGDTAMAAGKSRAAGRPQGHDDKTRVTLVGGAVNLALAGGKVAFGGRRPLAGTGR